MKKWIVRFVSLLVFNVVVLLIVGWFTPARVGWAALWAGIVMTALVIWVKPLIAKWFGSMAAKGAEGRSKLGEKLVGIGLAVAIAFIVWILTVILSGVTIRGFFLGYILPPLILLVGWAIYDLIDDKVEATAGELYDKATGSTKTVDAAPAPPSPQAQAARHELKDGLTEEQRRMLDSL
ncbi:MAG: hypothetical protein ACK5IN_07390 [Microbacterium sp.]|uniref:hypothetical protein n=1 Tax=Microbacterium sp. TaxID=51671 RepID=UPI003A88DA52